MVYHPGICLLLLREYFMYFSHVHMSIDNFIEDASISFCNIQRVFFLTHRKRNQVSKLQSETCPKLPWICCFVEILASFWSDLCRSSYEIRRLVITISTFMVSFAVFNWWSDYFIKNKMDYITFFLHILCNEYLATISNVDGSYVCKCM